MITFIIVNDNLHDENIVMNLKCIHIGIYKYIYIYVYVTYTVEYMNEISDK